MEKKFFNFLNLMNTIDIENGSILFEVMENTNFIRQVNYLELNELKNIIDRSHIKSHFEFENRYIYYKVTNSYIVKK